MPPLLRTLRGVTVARQCVGCLRRLLHGDFNPRDCSVMKYTKLNEESELKSGTCGGPLGAGVGTGTCDMCTHV